MPLAMKVDYQSVNPEAGVRNFEILPDAIILEFEDLKFRYLYNAQRPGLVHVNEMKRLALAGDGLTTYVNKYVGSDFAAKLPLND